MKWVHITFGLLLFVVFTQTGAFMRADFPDKDAISQELRILMRSRHIYILFSSLIHIALGTYLIIDADVRRRIIQYLGSAVLFASSLLLVWAFISETYSVLGYSALSRNGIYLSLAGVGLHLLGGLTRRRI